MHYWALGALVQEVFKSYIAEHRINWKFIVEAAPWWGGWWERLVRSVKTALKKVLGRSSLCFEALTTVLAEVEAMVNSRPLTYLYSEVGEPSVITPAHFLIGQSLTVLPETSLSNDRPGCVTQKETARQFQYRKIIMEHFWKRWRSEYLLELRSAHRYPVTNTCSLKVDDVVIVENNRASKLFWELGRIVETYPGTDGIVRACLVKQQNGTLIKRPAQKLYLLEIRPSQLQAREDVATGR